MKLSSDWHANTYSYNAFSISDRDNQIFDGQNFVINGHNKVTHLLSIHNCENFHIRNLHFIGGNTGSLRFLRRTDISYHYKKGTVYEIVDGGAVVISGRSSVIFENCRFTNNTSVLCGGAVSNQSTEVVIFDKCYFENNTSGHTGSAIDNLVPDSKIEVSDSQFVGNKSNLWYMSGYPHGQISIFPNAQALIRRSKFISGSIPFDHDITSKVEVIDNNYTDHLDWNEKLPVDRKYSIFFDNFGLTRKHRWVPLKTLGNVKYHIN